MMKPDRFIELLSKPESATEADIRELEQMTRKYEWFPTPKVLLAQIKHSQKHGDAHEALREAALFVGDRSQLFNQINFPKLREIIKEFEEELKSETTESENPTEPEIITPQAEKPDLVLEEKEPEQQQEENPANEEEINETFPPREEIIEGDNSETEPTTELEREIILEAVKSVIEREVSEDIEAQRQSADARTEEVIVQSGPEITNDVDPFAAWLLTRSKETGYEVKSHSASKAETTTQTTAPKKKSAAQLIDDFIKNEPKITPGKAEAYENASFGATALIEDESFVTETLAAIYARQGKIAKAKRAYKLLALKYPEKSIYFAAQLKKLEKGEI
jgi:hypothetical protein